MSVIRYTVGVTFPDERTAERWLRWLRDGHVAEVLAGGATRAEVVRLDGSGIEYEVQYHFPDRAAFERYERDDAPRLRAEGLQLFPTEQGIRYRRNTGLVTDQFPG